MYSLFRKSFSNSLTLIRKLNIFILSLLLLHLFLNLGLIVGVMNFGFYLSPLHILFFILFTVGPAFDLTEMLLSLYRKKLDLSKLDSLDGEQPSVALLYLCCDDFMSEAFKSIAYQNYSNFRVFILDDSVDEISNKLGSGDFTVIRRPSRKGYKAGNLNYWLKKFSSDYPYFIVLDSDSIIPSSFISKMVQYAEHPANSKIAIFQSKILTWNRKWIFPKIISTLVPYRMFVAGKLANLSYSLLSWGHNNLHRTNAINLVGGFDEKFIAEDAATSLNLIRSGYQVKLVDVISYDSEPFHIFAYTQRSCRWAKQTLQLIKANWDSIPFSVCLQAFRCFHQYFATFYYGTGLILLAYFAKSTKLETKLFLHQTITNMTNALKYALIAMLIPCLFFLLRLPFVLKLRIQIREYMLYFLTSILIHSFLIIPLCVEMIKYMITGRLVFDVTNKYIQKTSFWCPYTFYNMLTVSILIVLCVFGNLEVLIFNWVWLALLAFSPVLLKSLEKIR